MARLAYIMESEGTSADLRSIYDEIIRLRGGVLNLYRILANQPPALRAFMSMSRYVRDESSLQPQLRELAILVTAYGLNVEYERVHHLTAARKVGVPEPKLRDIATWRTSDTYTPVERAVMAYADQVAHSRHVDDPTVDDLLGYLSPQGVVDLAITVAWYHFCAALIVPLGVEMEEAPPGRTSHT
jgi:4-carboxymuconolactone decarboxylase